jgi:hypothetical protein
VVNLNKNRMNELETFIEEIELYRGNTLNKKEVYQRLQEIKQELTKPLIIHDVIGSKLTESEKKDIEQRIKKQFTGIKY